MQVLPIPPASTGLPSPTLTNPDMILPDSSPSSSSSPSTLRKHQQLPSPPPYNMNEHHLLESMPEEVPKTKAAITSPFQNGVLRRHDGSVRLRSSSERGHNRITFENNRLSYRQDEEPPIMSSPALEEDAQERIYTESTQGDFEYGQGTYTTPAILEEDEDDPHSHAAMTRRAEEILANAKKRLTNMEGNLTRARSTFQTRPSSSMSSFENRSPEPVSLYTIPGKGRRPNRLSPAKHRQANPPGLDESNQGHARVFSETSVPSSLKTGMVYGKSTSNDKGGPDGIDMNGVDLNVRDRHSEPGRNWFWHGLTRDPSLRHANRHANGLEALNEDGPVASFEQRAARDPEVEEEEKSINQPPTAAEIFNDQNTPNTGLTRARSTNQMHDLREQMQDLKGKISVLKQRAREDNMRRRSLQSLRTPSPFTVAEQWYTGAPPPEDMQDEKSASIPNQDEQTSSVEETSPQVRLQDSGHASLEVEHNRNHQDSSNVVDGRQAGGSPDELTKAVGETSKPDVEIVNGFPSPKQRLTLADKPVTAKANGHVDNSPVEEISPEDLEAQNDSIDGEQDYHESSTSPVVERHEDRPDAFDYEHFVLSSALGTYSGVGVRRSSSRRKRANSQSSESSVETTKPRNSTGDPSQTESHSNGVHIRQNSIDSNATTNTYATANEESNSEGEQDSWTFGHTRAGSRQAEPERKHKVKGSDESAPARHTPNGIQSSGSRKHIATAQKGFVNGNTRRSPRAENEKPTQPQDLLTVLSATDSWQEGAPPTQLGLGDRDRELAERLVKSLAKVCSQLHSLKPEDSMYEARIFRRKLDAARRVLDGEMNGEAF